ncbi:MAG: ferritin-like domain-containing protein [Isosphaeraceae bacterium]
MDLYIEELRDLYSAERQIIKALPKMAKAATAPELKSAFTEHLAETKGQVERLQAIFEKLGKKATGKTCRAMEGIVIEGEELIEEKPESSVLDAGLISAAQRVEHYEIAGYGSVRTYAQTLGESEAAKLLQLTLDEEGATDKKLTALAERLINERAT